VSLGRAIGIGSPRASLEANYALRALVGPANFSTGFSGLDGTLTASALDIMRRGRGALATLREAGQCDAVLVLGEDVMATAPILGLAILQAARRKPMKAIDDVRINAWDDGAVREFLQDARGPVHVAAPARTGLSRIASEILLSPGETAVLGFAVARRLSGLAADTGAAGEIEAAAGRIAADLAAAERPLVVAGTNGGDEMILRAAANVAGALAVAGRKPALCLTFGECNSAGLAMMGGGRLGEAMDRVRDGQADTVVVLENDLYRRAGREAVDDFLGAADTVVVLDHLETETTARAHFVLPAATFAESDGTLVNNEGRAQRFFKVMPPPGGVRESWRWLAGLAAASGRIEAELWRTFDDIVRDLAQEIPGFAAVREAAPGADFRIHGEKIARQPQRWSGRTANEADKDVHEPRPPQDVDSPLAFSMEGSGEIPPTALLSHFWSPGWNSVQSVNKFQDEVGGPLRGGDPGRRLVEPTGVLEPFPDAARAPEAGPGAGLWIVPRHLLFGTEELSASARTAATVVPEPELLVHPEDAAVLGLAEGDAVEIEVGDSSAVLPVRLTPDVARGVGAAPFGLPGLAGFDVPGWGLVKAVRP
jgi:NADH-quinone oxidoreductase subunit G